jgi:hypothetical protein
VRDVHCINDDLGNFEIGQILHLKSEIRNIQSD